MIAGAGFAMMAWRLAYSRAANAGKFHEWPTQTQAKREYYRIIDKAARAFALDYKRHAAARLAGHRYESTVRL